MGYAYQTVKALLSDLELTQIPAEDSIAYFHIFYDWLNQEHGYFHYIELSEFWENGIEDNAILKKLGVDTMAMQEVIGEKVSQVFEQCDDYDDECDDVMQKVERIIYDNILAQVPRADYCLLRVVRENPYWMLVPNQAEKVEAFIQAFNQAFNEDGDMLMVRYP